MCVRASWCMCANVSRNTDACARQYVCELLHKCGGPHVRNGLVLVLASSLRHVCLRECLCLRPFSSMCFCTCALFRIASASLHEVRNAARESCAHGTRAEIRVYIKYMYMYL